MNVRGYDVEVQPLGNELGGGFVAFAPALMGCLADGETRVEAIDQLQDAIDCWLAAARQKARRIPPATKPDAPPPATRPNPRWSLNLFKRREK